jgi:Protein of unknown function (DUF1579)
MKTAIVERTAVLAAGVLLLVGSTRTWAQQGAPQPGPEHKKLAYYSGKWTTESEIKPNPFMPPGKYTSKDDCGLFQGGFAVVCHSDGNGPMGPMKSVGIMGYSSEDKVYTYYGIDNMGTVPTSVSRGSVTGETWVYTDESKMGGKLVKSRYTIKQVSPTSYTATWEMQGEGGAWATVMESKSSKAN